jgi:hypothetical protein
MKGIAVMVFSVAVLLLISCAGGRYLRVEPFTDANEMRGSYTAIFYGGTSSVDLETVVVLDLEGDGYEFVPRAPEFEYRVEEGLSREEALPRAERFLSWYPDFMRVRMSRVLAPDGTVIGYELRPLFRPFAYGWADILDVLYLLKEDRTVSVYVRLKPEVERSIRDDGGKTDFKMDGH